jgi:DNA ligase (NAD+)
VGDDVTVNVNHMANVPQRIAVDEEEVEVRGEVYISTFDVTALNDARRAANESQFATPRNAAAGSLRQLDSSLVKERNIKFFAYEIRGLADVTSQIETLQSLKSLGFSVAAPWAKFALPVELDRLREHVVAMGDEKERSQRGFDTDGVVVKINRFELRETLGHLSRYPNWAVAYKFPASEAETTLEGISVQVGRTGVLTPVAILQRVLVGGVFVERATLHNEEEVRRLKLRPGLTVRVKRSGDVIPKIVGVGGLPSESSTTATLSDYALPCLCPVCGSPTEREEGGVLVRCTGGVACSAQAIEQNRHFCSRDAADIEGFGAATAEELYDLGIVKTPADIFKLRKLDQSSTALEVEVEGEKKQRLRGSKGWGDRSVNNLLAAIDSRRTLYLHRFIYALGVRHVGQETAKDLASKFRTFSALWSSLSRGNEGCDELLSINGIGPKAVSALLRLAKDERSRTIVQELLSEMTILDDAGVQDAEKAPSFDPAAPSLQGQTVVFTGKFKLFLRKKAEELSVERGATVGKAITRQTTLLVEAASSAEGGVLSTKAKKARSSGVHVIAEQDFVNMFFPRS